MKFQLVDKILSLEPGKRIVGVKALSLAEEYLADHFPAFPVLPGVMMLEGMTQSAAWLVRLEQDWARSVVVLQSARNVRYASFAKPGDLLRFEVEAVSIEAEQSKFKASTYVGDQPIVSAKLTLASMNLADRAQHLAGADEEIRRELKATFERIGGRSALAGVS